MKVEALILRREAFDEKVEPDFAYRDLRLATTDIRQDGSVDVAVTVPQTGDVQVNQTDAPPTSP